MEEIMQGQIAPNRKRSFTLRGAVHCAALAAAAPAAAAPTETVLYTFIGRQPRQSLWHDVRWRRVGKWRGVQACAGRHLVYAVALFFRGHQRRG
jgi:hypothetical protein